MKEKHEFDLVPLLDYIDPAALNYAEWCNVGMALKHEGYTCQVWEDWSKRDRARYHAGECARKWEGFHGSASPVTGATITNMAKVFGWTPRLQGHELDWDDEITYIDEVKIVDPHWVEPKEIPPPPPGWDGGADLIEYLRTLFDSTDIVGYVTESWEQDGRALPTKGHWNYTAGEIIAGITKHNGDVGAVLGDYNPAVGAWIRFNPLDGQGVMNENVRGFRFALVESDAMDINDQYTILKELELPIACLVHSGKKSLHAIVRVDADTYEEYRKRVDYLYTVCQKNGLVVDKQNRNPSRLSRMPGVMRNGIPQYLIATNMGKASWSEWKEWIEGVNDDLPDPESVADVWDDLPALAPPLIDGVLRQGHKLLLAGPSKAGKSYALIELCCAIAEGRPWLGFDCTQGRVMYVNLELDRASCLHRFRDVYEALGWRPDHLKNIDVWNLRGRSIPMDKLAPKLIRRALKKDYIAIVIDPIYKIITGDENSADQMANFCNQFDKVCTELGCAVIYCHHHSKGSQTGKRSMDRASGSGVFARDPDALLDLIELPVNVDITIQQVNDAVRIVCTETLRTYGLLDTVSLDDLCSELNALEACRAVMTDEQYTRLVIAVNEAHSVTEARTAWRIDGTLREFPKFKPIDLWFRYPVHIMDRGGVLQDVDPDTSPASGPWSKRKKTPAERAEDRHRELEDAFAMNDIDGTGMVSIKDIMASTGRTRNTIKQYIDAHPGFKRDEAGMVSRCQK